MPRADDGHDVSVLQNMGATVRTILTLRIDPDDLAAVDAIADDEVTTRSDVLRGFIADGLARDRRKRERMSR